MDAEVWERREPQGGYWDGMSREASGEMAFGLRCEGQVESYRKEDFSRCREDQSKSLW